MLALELLLRKVKLDGPVVHILIVRLSSYGVSVPAKHTPVNVVQVLGGIALAHLVHDAVGKVGREVVCSPVVAVLLGLQRLVQVKLVSVSVLSRRLVGGADTPYFLAGALLVPVHARVLRLAGLDHDVVLGVLSEDAVSVDGQSVGALLDAGDLDVAGAWVDVGPVLVGFGVTFVVLEVDAVLGQDSEWLGGALGELDVSLPRSALGGWDVVRHVFGNVVVEVGVPVWCRVLQRIRTKLLQCCCLGALVIMEIGLWVVRRCVWSMVIVRHSLGQMCGRIHL